MVVLKNIIILFKDDIMKKINAVYVSLAALVIAIIALVMCIVCCSCKKGSDVEKVLMEKQQIVMDALHAYEDQQRADALKQVEETVKAHADDLYNRADDGVIAHPDGKIVLVEFFDFSCGYCHRLYPALKEIIANNPDVKVVFKPLTFVAGAVSVYQAKAGFAAYKQGKFIEFYTNVMKAEGRMTEASVDEVAKSIPL